MENFLFCSVVLMIRLCCVLKWYTWHLLQEKETMSAVVLEISMHATKSSRFVYLKTWLTLRWTLSSICFNFKKSRDIDSKKLLVIKWHEVSFYNIRHSRVNYVSMSARLSVRARVQMPQPITLKIGIHNWS